MYRLRFFNEPCTIRSFLTKSLRFTKNFAECFLAETTSRGPNILNQIVRFEWHQFHMHMMEAYTNEINAKSVFRMSRTTKFLDVFSGVILRWINENSKETVSQSYFLFAYEAWRPIVCYASGQLSWIMHKFFSSQKIFAAKKTSEKNWQPLF